jgi:hypothetical protein
MLTVAKRNHLPLRKTRSDSPWREERLVLLREDAFGTAVGVDPGGDKILREVCLNVLPHDGTAVSVFVAVGERVVVPRRQDNLVVLEAGPGGGFGCRTSSEPTGDPRREVSSEPWRHPRLKVILPHRELRRTVALISESVPDPNSADT